VDWYYFAMVVYFYSGHWWIFTPALTKELLIFGIGCNEKVSSLQNHIETEEHINVIGG